jgi:excisionase family DNA binding protein
MATPHIPPTERLQVRIAEAAELLSISERHLRRLMASGEIRSVGRGRLRRVAIAELRRWQQQEEGR